MGGGVIYAADYTGSDVEATADTYYTLRSTTLVPGDYLVNAYVVPKENKKDVEELPQEVKDSLKIEYMSSVEDAVKFCFVK